MEFPPTSLPTEVQSLPCTSSNPSVRPLTSDFISLPGTTQKVMAKPNGWTRPSSSTSRFIVPISKIIGPNSCPLLSSCITMLWVLPPEYHYSLLIRATTWKSQFIQNVISHLLRTENTLLTLTPSISSFVRKWLSPKSSTKDPPIPNDPWPQSQWPDIHKG